MPARFPPPATKSRASPSELESALIGPDAPHQALSTPLRNVAQRPARKSARAPPEPRLAPRVPRRPPWRISRRERVRRRRRQAPASFATPLVDSRGTGRDRRCTAFPDEIMCPGRTPCDSCRVTSIGHLASGHEIESCTLSFTGNSIAPPSRGGRAASIAGLRARARERGRPRRLRRRPPLKFRRRAHLQNVSSARPPPGRNRLRIGDNSPA